MTSTELAVLGSSKYHATVTPLKSGGRRDVVIHADDVDLEAFSTSDIMAALRRFFSAFDAVALEYRGDPVALTQALARMDTLAADVRAARDAVRTLAAEALDEARIRRLSIEGVAAVESTLELRRSEWQHERLLSDLLSDAGLALLDTNTGERLDGAAAASRLLEWLRPEWRLTAVKQAGLDPNGYCRIETDDDDKPVRTPAVRIINNLTRQSGAV